MIEMRWSRKNKVIGPQMKMAVRVVEVFHNGKAPSKLSVYRNMRTRNGRWSNMFLSAVVERAISAGLFKTGKGKGGQISLEITDRGREVLDK